MATIDWLTMKAKDAFSAEKLEVALHCSNRLINDLQQQTASALELRASIWERKGNLVEELKDALLIIKCDESNISAYLRAAKVYFKQERLQEAIDILQKALHTRPSIEECSVIEQQIAKAEERLKRRVDFITAVPYDIVCSIFNHLGPDEAFICLDVCGRWREVLLNCLMPWETVTPAFECWHDGFDMVPMVSQHVRSLALRDSTEFIVQGFKFLNEYQFPRLKCLEIVDSDNNNSLLGDPLYEVLHQVADTLTELRIQARTTISIGKLLTICSNLTGLELFVKNISDWTTGLPTATLLTTASITSHLPADRNDLIPFFQCAPRLQRIMLRPLRDATVDISPFIKYCGPDLSYIFTEFGGYTSFHWATPCESSGRLEQISLGNIGSTIPWLSRLVKATDSLRELHIKAANDGRDSTLADWRPLSSFTMHKLTCLSISAEACSALYQHIPIMLQCYPALERFKLMGGRRRSMEDIVILDDIFAAVANLTNLYDLQLKQLPLGQGFNLLIEKYAVQEAPALKSLRVQFARIPDCVLYNIARIRSLEKLNIFLEAMFYPSEAVDEFTRLVAELPYLKEISFYGHIKLTDDAARKIASSKSLEVLNISNPSLTKMTHSILEHLFLHSNR